MDRLIAKQTLPALVDANLLSPSITEITLPLIVIVHSTAIVASFVEATEMTQPTLAVRAHRRNIGDLAWWRRHWRRHCLPHCVELLSAGKLSSTLAC